MVHSFRVNTQCFQVGINEDVSVDRVLVETLFDLQLSVIKLAKTKFGILSASNKRLFCL